MNKNAIACKKSNRALLKFFFVQPISCVFFPEFPALFWDYFGVHRKTAKKKNATHVISGRWKTKCCCEKTGFLKIATSLHTFGFLRWVEEILHHHLPMHNLHPRTPKFNVE